MLNNFEMHELNPQNIRLVDLTLRDGEQAAAVVFARQEKVRIAKLLDEIGIQQIEIGSPRVGAEELDSMRAITSEGLDAHLLAFCRARVDDVEDAANCDVDGVVISIGVSDIHIQKKFKADRAWVMQQVRDAVEAARTHGLDIIISAEDASRADPAFLQEYFAQAKELGAARVRFCDTVGVLDPFTTFQKVKALHDAVGCEIEMHCHNDFGMATANAVAGLRAGATHVACSIGGLGERAGNAALEEVVMALKILADIQLPIKTDRFREIAEYVADASARAVPIWKAVVGTNIFAHESGIHADGVLKDPRTYEAFTPEEVGLTRQLVVGKHSGSHTIVHKFHGEWGIDLTEQEAQDILSIARHTAVELKRALFDKELRYIYNDYKKAQAKAAK